MIVLPEGFEIIRGLKQQYRYELIMYTYFFYYIKKILILLIVYCYMRLKISIFESSCDVYVYVRDLPSQLTYKVIDFYNLRLEIKQFLLF